MDEKGMTEPVLIAKENVPIILEVIGKDIEEVVDEFTMGHCTYHSVVEELYHERRQLWVLASEEMRIQGWLVTKIQNIAGGKRLILDLFGGNGIFNENHMDLLLSHLDKIEKWAQRHGATESFGYVRPGLRRKLKKHGFHHVCDLVIRPLTGIH